MKKTKIKRAIAAIVAFVLIAGIAYIANGLIGNPVSKMLSRYKAEKYIQTQYADYNLSIDNVNYDFKIGSYYVNLSKPNSLDIHFTLYCDFLGNVIRDTYEWSVTDKTNTWTRLNNQYQQAADEIFETDEYFKTLNTDYHGYMFGNLVDPMESNFEYEIDGVYKTEEFAATDGELCVSIYTDKPANFETLAETLLGIKEVFDRRGLAFYSIELFVSEGAYDVKTDNTIAVLDFLYSDIYPDGLVERVQANHEKHNNPDKAELIG